MSRIELSHQFALIKRSQTKILLIFALATLGACAPLAEVRQINPKLGAQHGTPPQLQALSSRSRMLRILSAPTRKKLSGFI
jgi:hypothetical protein